MRNANNIKEKKLPDVISCDPNDCNTIEEAKDWLEYAHAYVLRCINTHGNNVCPAIEIPAICGDSACNGVDNV